MRTSEAISIWTVYGIWLDQHSSQIGFFLHEKTFFLHTCTPYSELPSNIRTMIMSFMLQCNHAYKFARAPKKLFADWEINNVYVAEGLQGWTKIYAYFFYWLVGILVNAWCPNFEIYCVSKKACSFCVGNRYLQMDLLDIQILLTWNKIKCFYLFIYNTRVLWISLLFLTTSLYSLWLSWINFSVCLFMPIFVAVLFMSLYLFSLSLFF